mgnify:CR=1 FL=1
MLYDENEYYDSCDCCCDCCCEGPRVPEDFVVLQEVSVQQGQLVSESPVLREPQE